MRPARGSAYAKPHGALYNATVHHEGQARAVVEGAPGLRRLAPGARLPLPEAAEAAGLRTVREVVIRAQHPEVPSAAQQLGPALHDPAEVAARVVRLVTDARSPRRGRRHGGEVAADSVCVHGDSPGAVAMATAVRADPACSRRGSPRAFA